MAFFSAQNLTRRVDGRALFEGLSFSLERGGRLAVSAPSGAGKTSLLRALAWLDPVDDGTVALEGKSPAALGVPAYRRRVAYVPQEPAVLEGTPRALHDVLLGFAQNRREGGADELAARLGRWGLGLADLDKSWSVLSGGERQRIHLAFALDLKPDVLLLDEPTSALDAETMHIVEADLCAFTSVWVSHDAAQRERVATEVLTL